MRTRHRPPGIALALAVLGVLSSDGATAEVRCAPFDHEHAAWSRILSEHVRAGRVDYRGLHRSGQPALMAYLRSVEAVCRPDYERFGRPQQLAFWINAYNAYTIRLILDHYPVRSIRSIGFLPNAAFRTSFIDLRRLRGETMSLNDIEHGILRVTFREPRIHFALVCASRSCPDLRPEAYRAGDLERQLDEEARRFLRDGTKNRYDPVRRVFWLSKIFDWFARDFDRASGSVVRYVAPYVDAPTGEALRAGNVEVEFLEYDWSLNGR